jgi:hypothetical protein
MRESWERLHKGLDNAHKVAILEEGSDFVALIGDARSAQLLESREFDAREIANIFGVPTHKLGDPSKVAYNSLGEENQSYYDDTLSRWLQLWSDECSDKLLGEDEKASESHVIDFDYSELKRANLAALTAYATAAINGRWETPDGIRALFGMNPMPGPAGDAVAADPAPTPTADPAAARAALRPLLVDAARRLARRLADGAHKARAGKFEAWAGSLHRSLFMPTVAPLANALRTVLPVSLRDDEAADMLAATAERVMRSAWPDHIQAGADELAERVGEEWADSLLGAAA